MNFKHAVEKYFPYLLLAPVVLPIVIGWGLMYPFLVPKTLLFYALGLLAVGAFAYLVSVGKQFYYDRLTTWTLAPAALLVLAYLASLLGLDFYRSFWSVFARGDGLLMLTLSVASFYGILLSADSSWLPNFSKSVAVVATLAALYACIEWLVSGGRVESTIGNAAFLAGYLGVALFISLAASESAERGWRRALKASAALQLLAIILTSTRGTILALVVAVFAWLVYQLFLGEAKKRQSSAIALAVLVILAGGFFLLRKELAQVPFSPIARVASISTSDEDVASRLFVWSHMLGEIKKSPYFGYGAEHIDVIFNRFYDPSVISEEWFDRSHNAYLDYAVQYGLLGPVLYIAIILLLGMTAWRRMKKDSSARWLVLGALVYAVQNFFVFDTISSWWLFLALTAILLAAEDAGKPRSIFATRAEWAGILAALFFALLIIPCSILPFMADYDLAHGYLYHVTDVATANAYFAKGEALGTYADLEYGYQLYAMYTGEQYTGLSGQARVAAYDAARTLLAKNYQRYSFDARTALYYAHVLSEAPPEEPADPTLITQVSTRTIELSPKRYQPWYVLTNLLIDHANLSAPGTAARAQGYQAGISLLKQYEKLVPNLSEPHFVLAELYLALKDGASAATEAQLGRATYHDNLQAAERAVPYYETVQDWPNALFFLKEVVRINPNNHTAEYDLAKVEYVSGDPSSALETYLHLQAVDPSILASDPAFVNAITAYEQSPK